MVTQPAPLDETARALRSGELDPVGYVGELCDRVERVDPDVRALLAEPDRRERLASEAERLRDRHPEPEHRPPLYGVPVGVKDIVHVDGFTTRAGSALPPELLQGPEAPVVTALRDAGALVLGKTVTTEFAGFAPGPTRNPHDRQHTPGGSSSGSAAAVAAGLAPLAIGTQTGGSVIRPAAFCGIVGFKPSLGRIPTEGVLPRSTTVDHVGLFTQDVRGTRRAAPVVCDDWDPVDPDRRPVLGVPRGAYLERASETALDRFERQVEALEADGYEVRRVRAFEDFEAVDRWHRRLTTAELALVHTEWIAEYEPFYRTSTAERIREGQDVTAGELAEARAGCETVRESVHATMADAGVDAWVCPAAPGPAPEGIASTGDSVMNRPWTYAGVPAATVPAGQIDGLPVGLQVVARFEADERLLAWAGRLAETVRGRGA
jgi:Asp-tRNA(Asn)/Glu-tRNA(Gln) amidotransferase A subunit family amidase